MLLIASAPACLAQDIKWITFDCHLLHFKTWLISIKSQWSWKRFVHWNGVWDMATCFGSVLSLHQSSGSKSYWGFCSFFFFIAHKMQDTTDVITTTTFLFCLLPCLLCLPCLQWCIFQSCPWSSMRFCTVIFFTPSHHSWCFPVISN